MTIPEARVDPELAATIIELVSAQAALTEAFLAKQQSAEWIDPALPNPATVLRRQVAELRDHINDVELRLQQLEPIERSTFDEIGGVLLRITMGAILGAVLGGPLLAYITGDPVTEKIWEGIIGGAAGSAAGDAAARIDPHIRSLSQAVPQQKRRKVVEPESAKKRKRRLGDQEDGEDSPSDNGED